jgi:hypothetical protein
MHMPFMGKALLLSVLAVTLTACATPGKYSASRSISTQCADGSTFVNVDFGDSNVKVNPVANVKRNAALEFRLRAGQGYEDKLVTIRGKAAKDGWISASGSDDGRDNKLIVCVPSEQAEGTYYYLVQVEDVGTLDPRANVTR